MQSLSPNEKRWSQIREVGAKMETIQLAILQGHVEQKHFIYMYYMTWENDLLIFAF